MYGGIEPTEDELKCFNNHMKTFDQLIGDNIYLTGDTLTIADISIFSNILFIQFTEYDLSGLTNFNRWMTTLQTTLPFFNEVFMSATPQEFQEFAAKAKEYLKRKMNE